MKYHVLIEGGHIEVTVEAEGGGYRVSLVEGPGETSGDSGDSDAADDTDVGASGLATTDHHVDIGVLSDGHAYSLLLDERSIDVSVEDRGNHLELMVAGRRYVTEVLGEREWIARSIQGDSIEGEKTVRASMSGIVRDVLVKLGDPVVRGQTLFILEAMKMENEVKAEVDGTVATVTVNTGDTVDIGDVVVEIE